MCPKNKSINRLKNLKYRNIYINIDRNRMLDIVIHYSYVWNLSLELIAPKCMYHFPHVTIMCHARTGGVSKWFPFIVCLPD
jgi:hypothetical protein